MSDSKLADRFATPNSSKLAQILLDLRGVETQAGMCNLQPTDVQLWPEAFKSETDDGSNTDFNNQQDTCNCRKSKCLKLYCQCFAARATCSASCRCLSCENRPENGAVRDAAVNIILERNPNAFDSKYRPTGPAMVASTFTAISSIAHKNGCRCRKSLCLKKYCECFQGGVPCSAICTCLTCQNTGPGAHAMAAPVITLAATEALAAERESSQLLLSEHIQLSNQSIFMDSANHMDVSADSSATSSSRRKAADEEPTADSSRRRSFAPAGDLYPSASSSGSSGAAGSSSAAGAAGICKPPLVPSHKRKRDSRTGSGAGAAGDEAAYTNTVAAPSSSGLIATPAWSREEQQQLLKQLLYQELESQGILSSPFASFINHNCPGLLQSQDTCLSDISSILGQHGAASTAALFSSPAAAHTAPSAAAAPSVPATKLSGPYAASPNSISIATAIALLAANHAARGTSSGAGSVLGQSPFQHQAATPAAQHAPASTPGNAGALSLDAINRILNNSSTCTPQQFHSNQQHDGMLSQDCTDEETTGSAGSSTRSDFMLLSAGRPSALALDQATLPNKVLFGAELELGQGFGYGAHTPGTDSLLASGVHSGAGMGLAKGARPGPEKEKENAGPNSTSSDTIAGSSSSVLALLR